MMRLRGPLAALLLTILPASWAWAQATATTGQIEGTVFDESGAPLPGVTLTARNVETGFLRTAVSDAGGLYRLSLLPLGAYEVTAQLDGFATLKRPGLTLRVGETLRVPLSLKVASVAETITVTAEAPVVEVARSQSANTVNQRAIESLPINGRRFQDFVLLTPGAVLEGQRGGTSVSGQRGINASYAIDGASYDNPFFGGIRGGERSGVAYTISQESIKEFQVSNAGYSAEFGRSGGGVVNAVTKSGTNDVHGSAFWFFRNEDFTADDPYGRPPTAFKQHQFGATLGGPLKRDKAHYFLAYDQQLRDNPFAVQFSSNPAGAPRFEGQDGMFVQTNDVYTALARLDYQLNPDHHFWVRYNWSYNTGENGLSSGVTLNTVANSSLEKDTTHTVVAQLSSVLSANRLNELRLQFSREDRPREANTTDVTVTVAGLGTTGRVTFLPSLETDDRFQAVDTFTWLRGAHSWRAGFDLNFTHTQQPFFLSRSGGEYRFASVADYLTTVRTGVQRYRDYRQGFGRPNVDFWQQEYAVFLQDTWQARRNLVLNYGLRYEAQLEPQPDDPNPALPGSDRIPSDTDNLGPRLGVSWDPWNDGKGAIRVNAGLFYSRTPALLLVSPFTNNGRAQLQLTFLPTTSGAPVFPNVLAAPPTGASAPATDANTFAADFQNPRTFQGSFGIEREVLPSLALGVTYIHASMRHLERLLDVNMLPPSGTAADGRLLYPRTRPNPAFTRILQAESTARGTYDAVTLSAQKRLTRGTRWYDRGLELQAFYTYSRGKDDDSNERNFSGIFYQDWQHLDREYTWSSNDVRHNFVMNATWELPAGLRLGAIFMTRSGLPYTRLANIDLNGDANFSNDRQFIGGKDTGRNGFRQPGFSRLDVRLAKTLGFGGQRSLELGVDVFNALDAENRFVGVRNTTFNGAVAGSLNPELGVPDTQSGDPRTGQVSVRVRF